MTGEEGARPIFARLNDKGQLVSADPALLRLHLLTGGHLGSALALPQLAAVVRLAQQKVMPLKRSIMLGDGPDVRMVDVDVQPDAEGIGVTLTQWDRLLSTPEILGLTDTDFDYARLESDGAWRTDANLLIVRMAAGIDRDLGFLPATARGQNFTRIFRLLPDATGDIPLLAALANRVAFENQPAELIVSTPAPILLSGSPVFDSEGSFAGLTGTVRLLAPAQQAAPDIQPTSDLDLLLADRLEPALRAPIARVIDHADALALQAEGPLREDYVRYAEDIGGAARHLLGLIDDLANVNAIEQPDFSIQTEALDLVDVARRAIGLLSVRAMERKVQVHPPGGTLIVQGDFGRVLQIMVNLLANAIRHAPQDGEIRIEPVVHPARRGLAVVDEGQGIAQEHHERVFAKFERLDPHSGSGSGLGLYISRKLARAMGGDILLESQPGQGARFTLVLEAGEIPSGDAP